MWFSETTVIALDRPDHSRLPGEHLSRLCSDNSSIPHTSFHGYLRFYRIALTHLPVSDQQRPELRWLRHRLSRLA
jgi:hypothetical protein